MLGVNWLCFILVMTLLQAGSGHLCSESKCHFFHLGMKYVIQQKQGSPATPHPHSHILLSISANGAGVYAAFDEGDLLRVVISDLFHFTFYSSLAEWAVDEIRLRS